jgi:oxygen-independent coproporphyrinogen III oxidase
MKHLYVHIPFCRSRCAYCDFASEPVGPHSRAGRVEAYVETVRAELAERLGPAGGLETVYLGGGTPTVLPRELLLELVREAAGRLRAAPRPGRADDRLGGPLPEFTIEANPGTIDEDLLGALAEAGVTRLSLGVQSFSPALRAALGRRVAQGEIESSLAAVGGTGRREWNLDLVFGIPGQTWESAAADIDAAAAAGPTHISMYDLTYTRRYLAHLEKARRAAPGPGAGPGGGAPEPAPEGGVTCAAPLTADPDDLGDSFAETYFARAVARLEAGGYRRYEVSNFALPGHECRHNLAYWRGEDYLGLGASAVSTIGAERRTNPRTVAGYLGGDPPETEWLTPGIRLWEKAMLGLRTIEGVDEREVAAVLDPEARARLVEQGFLEGHCGKLRLNTGFLDISNAVISALLVRPEGLEAAAL